jgi:hypothetical protein
VRHPYRDAAGSAIADPFRNGKAAGANPSASPRLLLTIANGDDRGKVQRGRRSQR